MRKHKIILNPWAGRGAGARIRGKVVQALTEQGIHFDLALTEGPRHAVDLARQGVDTHDVVVAVGGDGTVHEVVNGLAQGSNGGAPPTMGIIPLGSGDDFAYSVGIPRHKVQAAVETIARGQPKLVDLARVNNQVYDNDVSVAFAGRVLAESKKIKAPLGPLVYLIAIFQCLAHNDPTPLRIRWEGGEVEGPMLMASVSNGRRIGGAFHMAPNAKLDDSQLDIVYGDAMSAREIVAILPKLARGTHIDGRKVKTVRSPWAIITGPRGMPVEIDGELIYTDTDHLELEVLPGRLRVLA